MSQKAKKHICFICSSGGHLNQALKIIDGLPADRFELTLVTYENDFTENLSDSKDYDVILFPQETSELAGNRWALAKHMFMMTLETINLLREERFDAIISTGAEIAVPMLALSPFLRAEFIYVESLSRIDDLSWTGQLSRFFADQQLVQWEELAEKYEQMEFKGRIV